MTDIERCDQELAEVQAAVERGGWGDGDRWGLAIGEADWQAEKWMVETDK